MKPKLQKLPITKETHEGYHWLDYKDDTVLLIKLNGQGEKFRIQYNGVWCSKFWGKGVLAGKFTSKSNHFNPNWWYKICSWYYDKNKIYIQKKNHPKCKNWADPKLNQIHLEQCEKYATPATAVLYDILKEASEKLRVTIQTDAVLISKDWGEAYIPVTVNGKGKYILTWHNCD